MAKLNLIGALRTVDIPICEIRSIVEGDKTLPEVMRDTLSKISETINNLEILNDDYRRYREIGAEIREEVDEELKREIGLSFNEFLESLLH